MSYLTYAVDPPAEPCKECPLERRPSEALGRATIKHSSLRLPMARSDYLFTSESVSEGHPDKVCDRISDEVVDLFFREGPKEGMSPWDIRAACETLCTTNRVVIAGETRGPKKVQAGDVEEAARKAIKDIGYEQDGFHWRNANVEVLLHAQSAHIAQGVDASCNKHEGAGDH